MITAIDTNILIDIFNGEDEFSSRSADLLRQAMKEGAVYACPIVWAETSIFFHNNQEFLETMATLEIEFSEFSQESTLLAANTWGKYRVNGGKKTHILADFLIAAHAYVQCDRLLTRDRGFYKSYFKNLRVLDSSKLHDRLI